MPASDYDKRCNPTTVAVPINDDYVYRQVGYEKELLTTAFPNEDESIDNSFSMLQRSARLYSDYQCLGQRPKYKNGEFGYYQWISYRELYDIVVYFGRGIRKCFPFLTRQSIVGMYGKNTRQLQMYSLGMQSQDMTIVPISETMSLSDCKYILNHSELSVIAVNSSTAEKLSTIIDECPHIKGIVVLDIISSDKPTALFPSTIQIYSFEEVINEITDQYSTSSIAYTCTTPPASSPVESFFPLHPSSKTPPPDSLPDDYRPKGDSLMYIYYNVSSEGKLKGVMITHKAMMISAASIQRAIEYSNNPLCGHDCLISYLPLSHSYESAIEFVCLIAGARIAYFSGFMSKLLEDITIARPTIMIGVPRIYERIYQEILQSISGFHWLFKLLFSFALWSQCLATRQNYRIQYWDKLFFRTIQESLGGRIRFFGVGGAPMKPLLAEFLSVCFNVPVIEGYGLTECCSTSNVVLNNGMKVFKNVGPPLAGCEIKLIDCPEMDYLVNSKVNPQGEILIRGPILFSGYYKDKESTAAVIDEDGWLHSGDIGRINNDGSLSIIDIKKTTFKLSQGEFIATDYLQDLYLKNDSISQIFIYGRTDSKFLVAIVVVNPEKVISVVKDMDVDIKNVGTKAWKNKFIKACKSTLVHDYIMDILIQIAKDNCLKGYEYIKDVYIDGNLNNDRKVFTKENGLLQSNGELNRYKLAKYYNKEIDTMYRNVEKNLINGGLYINSKNQ
ncbi:hypothetical protein WA158_006636 [Blastocystis sp. Blastoise]